MARPSVNCILNVHREEPAVLVPSARCLTRVVRIALEAGLDARITAVLDDASDLQREALSSTMKDSGVPLTLLEVSHRDLGLARNAGVNAAQADFVAFFDADDLWSQSWLVNAWKTFVGESSSATHVVVNAEYNVVFDSSAIVEISRNLDSDRPIAPHLYAVSNFSTSQIFTAHSTATAVPFPSRSSIPGFGHEDWEWSKILASQGALRLTASGTCHMIRRLSGHSSYSRQMNGWLPRPLWMLSPTE